MSSNLSEIKCQFCNKKFGKEDLDFIKNDILNKLYDHKKGFTKEDDFDLACFDVEQAFSNFEDFEDDTITVWAPYTYNVRNGIDIK